MFRVIWRWHSILANKSKLKNLKLDVLFDPSPPVHVLYSAVGFCINHHHSCREQFPWYDLGRTVTKVKYSRKRQLAAPTAQSMRH